MKIAALAGRLGVEPDVPLFRFLVRRIGIQDIRIDRDEIVYSSFLPVEQLLKETLQGLEVDGVRPLPCLKCTGVFDAEHEDGIFADPHELNGFICRACAEKLNAWSFYNDHLVQ